MTDWIIPATLIGVTASANWTIGRGFGLGARYWTPLVVAAAFWFLVSPLAATVGAALFAWRAVGWMNALDMGRVGHDYIRDFLVMAWIACLPAAGLILLAGNAWPAAFILAVPVSYTIGLYGMPYRPGWPHLQVAEALSGAALGAVSFLAFT